MGPICARLPYTYDDTGLALAERPTYPDYSMKVGLEHHVVCHLELGHSHRVDRDYLSAIRKATSTKSDSQIIFYSYCRRPFSPTPSLFTVTYFWTIDISIYFKMLVIFWYFFGANTNV